MSAWWVFSGVLGLLLQLVFAVAAGWILVAWIRFDVVRPRVERRRAVADLIESSRHRARFWATWGHP